MPEQTLSMTQQQLKDLIQVAASAAVQSNSKAMSPAEERKYLKEIEADERRKKMQIEFARIEDEALKRRQFGCSHARHATSGQNVAPGSPDSYWTTGGQLHGDDTATMVCMRCGFTWRWKTTPQERDYIQNSEHGMLGMVPPRKERLVQAA